MENVPGEVRRLDGLGFSRSYDLRSGTVPSGAVVSFAVMGREPKNPTLQL